VTPARRIILAPVLFAIGLALLVLSEAAAAEAAAAIETDITATVLWDPPTQTVEGNPLPAGIPDEYIVSVGEVADPTLMSDLPAVTKAQVDAAAAAAGAPAGRQAYEFAQTRFINVDEPLTLYFAVRAVWADHPSRGRLVSDYSDVVSKSWTVTRVPDPTPAPPTPLQIDGACTTGLEPEFVCTTDTGPPQAAIDSTCGPDSTAGIVCKAPDGSYEVALADSRTYFAFRRDTFRHYVAMQRRN
jgi:hypothetical protein